MSTEVVVTTPEQDLQFTGNWFIDAGILGFVNLMEEVYGWDLEELQKRIRKEPEKVYYGYFPFAYFYKLYLKESTHNNSDTPIHELKEFLENKLSKEENTRELFDIVWYDHICRLFTDVWVKNSQKKILKLLTLNQKNNDESESENSKKKKKRQNTDEQNEIPLEIRSKVDEISKLKKKLAENEKEISNLLFKNKGKQKTDDNKNLYKKIVMLTSEELNKLDFKEDQNELKATILEFKKEYNDLADHLKNNWKSTIEKKSIHNDNEKFYRLPISYDFYTNFLFFHFGKGNLKQKESLYNLISCNIEEESILGKIDKTINKLLPSTKDFSNINYTELSSKILTERFSYPFVYLICFSNAFEKYKGIGNVFFYSHDLKLSYIINKKLKKYKTTLELDKLDIFKLTWEQIIDTLIEYKSSWSLENMYIISYRQLDNKGQEDVEYVGIPKLQASILLDDKIRDELNKSIQFRLRDKDKPYTAYCWLLEEFIKGRPLYPKILGHFWLKISNNNKYFSKNSSLWALAVESTINNLTKDANKPFSHSEVFFKSEKRYCMLTKEIYNSYRKMYLLMKTTSSLFDKNEKESLLYELFSVLKTNDRFTFNNILLKKLNAKNDSKSEKSKARLIESIFEFNNDVVWKYYAMAILIGLLGDKNE